MGPKFLCAGPKSRKAASPRLAPGEPPYRNGCAQVVRGRARIRGGRNNLRTSLNIPTLVALRFNPDLKKKYQALKEAGKPSKVAITAMVRKLLVLANSLLQDDRKWNAKAA